MIEIGTFLVGIIGLILLIGSFTKAIVSDTGIETVGWTIILVFGAVLMVTSMHISEEIFVSPCEELNGTCEYYNCESDRYSAGDTSILLQQKYQNCLIKEGLDKGISVTVTGGN